MPNPQFSDDEIQQRIHEISHARDGAPGDPSADRQEAIRQLQQERLPKRKRSLFFWLNRPLVWIEKGAIEPTANWLDNADIFRILEKTSPIIEALGVIAGAIIIPITIWQIGERAQEAKEQQEKAIRAQTTVQNYLNQLSNTLATGKLKTDEDLQTIVRASTLALLDNPDLQPDPDLDDGENLRNDRKGQTIGYLIETGLVRANSLKQTQGSNQSGIQQEPIISLKGANLSGANLGDANFDSSIAGATLTDLFFITLNLSGADLSGADLSSANLSGANLSGADLSGANLSGANLMKANLKAAKLIGAKAGDANLIDADLSGANLTLANLKNAKLNDAKDDPYLNLAKGIYGSFTEYQLTEAELCNTQLPEGIDLDPGQDCEELGFP